MNRILVAALFCMAVSVCAGCKGLSFGKKKAEPEPIETAEQKQIRELRAEATTLKDKLAVRDSQVSELRQRADDLSKKVSKLEFIKERQEKQIDVLAQAPLARDEYKKLADELKTMLGQVTTRLGKLEAANKLLTVELKTARGKAGATQPSTRPAISSAAAWT